MAGGRSSSPFVFVAVVLAVLVGVVAAVLVGGSPTPPAPHAGELIVQLPTAVWGVVFLSPLLVGFTVLMARRLVGRSMSYSRRTLVQLLVVAAVAVLFFYLLTHGGGGGGGTVGVEGTPTSTNTTNTSGGHSNHSAPPPPTNSTGLGSSPSLTIPSWGLLLIVAAVTGCVAVVAAPGVVSLLVGRRRGAWGGGIGGRPDRTEAQNAFADAARAIDRGDDPRETIIRLYLRLLYQFGPRLGDIDHLTPEEIRTMVLAPLNVRADASEAVTRLFEEARYSTHTLGPDAANRCREALGGVEADLARSSAAS